MAGMEELVASLSALAQDTVLRLSDTAVRPDELPRVRPTDVRGDTDLKRFAFEHKDALPKLFAEAVQPLLAALDTPEGDHACLELGWSEAAMPALPKAIANYAASCDAVWFDGALHLVSPRVPAVARLDASGWQEVVTWDQAMACPGLVDGGRAARADGTLVLVGNNGACYRLEDGVWQTVVEPSDALKKRHGFDVVACPEQGAVLVHGGFSGSRGARPAPSMLWTGTTLKKVSGKKSPKLPDFDEEKELAKRLGQGVRYGLDTWYDTARGQAMRASRFSAGFFDGAWHDTAVPNLSRFAMPSKRRFVHDPSSGQTLIVNADGRIARFSMEGCDLVARTPPITRTWPERLSVFDEASRTLVGVDLETGTTHQLSLAPAFEAATQLA